MNNQLTSLKVSSSIALTYLNCINNGLTAAALNALFGTLHSHTAAEGKIIYILNNPGTDTCDQHIASAKGWTVDKIRA